jgi:hypothetical protein
MPRLQGQTTLTEEEKYTEAKRHVDYLQDFLEQMTTTERDFVERKADAMQRFGTKTMVSNRELFWLRDLALKY